MRSRIAALCIGIAVLAAAGGAAAQTGVSARLRALGNGHLAGIVRDDLTDIARNPALLAIAVEPATLYRYRSVPQRLMYVPILQGSHLDWGDTRLVLAVQPYDGWMHEIALYGGRVKGWTLGCSVAGIVSSGEDRTGYVRTDHRHGYEYVSGVSQDTRIDKEEYWHATATAARELGERASLGCRIGVTNEYNRQERTDSYAYQLFNLRDGENELWRESYGMESPDFNTRRRRVIYGTAGFVVDDDRGGRTELRLRIHRSSLYADDRALDTGIIWSYDGEPGEYEYEYEYGELADIRECDRWSTRLGLRREYPSGLALLLDGGIEWGALDTAWRQYTKQYDYIDHVNDRYCLNARFDTSSEPLRGFGTVRLGGTARLGEDLLLFGALSVGISHFTWEDDPLFSAILDRRNDLDTDRLEDAQSLLYEYRLTEIDGLLPVACEFTPRPWFAFRAGFVAGVSWERKRMRTSMPILDPETASLPEAVPVPSVETDETRTEMIRYATAGFSFTWKDRLVADLYTGADLTPDSMTSMTIDLRYLF